ncbi:MAG: hypothetical protein ACXWM8_06640 [Candidatus Limnocylindrales bacterium]
MPYQRLAMAVLDQWRAAERDLAAATPGSAEAERLQSEIARLRGEYLRLIEEATIAHRPVPPPLPDSE